MKRLFIPALILTFCALSCAKSGDTPEEKGKSSFEESVMDIQASIDPFVDGGQTKNSFDPSTLQWTWDMDDKLGFWSNPSLGSPAQVVFDVTSVDGNKAYFHGNGYGILRGCKYNTYFPYDENATKNAVTLSYTGQNPQENGGTGHLGLYDYMYSEGTAASSGDVSFQYHHLGCVARFTITVAASNVGKITKLTISTDDSQNETLVSSAVFDPFHPTAVLKNVNHVASIEYPLGENQAGVDLNSENKLIVYTMMSPTATNGRKFKATLLAANGNVYEGSSANAISGNQSAGQLYGYSITAIDKTGVTDLSYNGCANCYIVSAPGRYKFKANKGVSSTLVPYIRTTDPVSIYWETNNTSIAPTSGTIISNVSYSADDGYITFTKPSSFTAGNALIVIYDINNNIAWSWHIWCVQGITDEEYLNNAGILMDRNLGALETVGNLSNGLLYQWGRKDPLLGNTSIAGNTGAACAGTGTTVWTRDKNTYSNEIMINYTIYHPTVFVASATLDWLCYGQSGDSGLWHNSDGSKTDYDPCPPGYKVPDGSRGTTKSSSVSDWGFYAKAVNNNLNLTSYYTKEEIADGFDFTIDQTAYKVVRGNQYMSIPLKNGGTGKYPYTGYMREQDGTRMVGWVQIWSDFHYSEDGVNWSNTHPACLNVDMGSHQFYVNWNSGRAAGKAVRCQKIVTNVPLSSGQSNENLGNSTPSPSAW